MRYENGILHADTAELVGLIRTAQEIIEDLDGVVIPSDVELVLDQTERSPVRVAAFRLTNCIGAYNSGNTFDGLEPRWAWKDAQGVWHRETRAGALVAGMTRNEVLVRRWIADAPVVAKQPTNPVALDEPRIEIDEGPTPLQRTRLVGRSERSPEAYTNVPESVQYAITRLCQLFVTEGHVPGHVPGFVSLVPNRDYRIAVRRGRTWFWVRLRAGAAPISEGRSGRRAAIRWVDAG